jgi:sugar phosphate isomerase/epimerase
MLTIRDIGMAVGVPGGRGKYRQLEGALGGVYDLGYRLVELSPAPFAIILNGELQRRQLADFVAVLEQFDLRYTIHAFNRLNLAYDPRHNLCQAIMRCLIEICGTVGAERLVYHSGLQALDGVRHGVRRTLLTEQELAEGAAREIAAFRTLAPLATDAGVVIGMENGDSHGWEHNLIAAAGLPRAALLDHHARLRIEPIVRQLEAIDHPNIGLTLDIAHLHIAAHDLGFDYLAAIEAAAPWVRHLHVNDNFGLLDQGFDHEPDRWAFGEADLHLPPGWGTIPYAEVFARLPSYQGDLILEIKAGFADELGDSLTAMQQILAGLSRPPTAS